MIILAVDLGDVRTGLAVCDEGEILASPAGVIHESSQKKLLPAIKQIAEDHKSRLIVVGHPRNMDGSFGARAVKCEKFAQQLQNFTRIKVELFDERVTTKAAGQKLNDLNIRGKRRKSIIDEMAAVEIMQGFLDYRKSRI
ncbi:MAG: Holliday junction resolvase RuvX [Oscillospiraceae bacterium]|nr:Holliday junction resolvase RuvX [Oscillospiraceae bacterium]